ncbi:unnamed protein product [Vicia faba]|uniref:Uncharacterized protein n=1 Tax=Vicia faba TaxID=3906 RepID=A0AAV0Z5C1_VICFA|nr:unnamed protein product [Vicia faba]
MKLGCILVFVCTFSTFLSLTLGSASTEVNLSFCPRHLDLPGKCSTSRSCGLDMNAALGASAMVQDCICEDLANNMHRCTCCCKCQIVKDRKTLFLASIFVDGQLKCNKV